MVWGGRREEGSGWGTHVYLWRIHFDIWQNQYNYVKFKNKIKLKKKKRKKKNGPNQHFTSLQSYFPYFMAAVTICSDFGAPKNKV